MAPSPIAPDPAGAVACASCGAPHGISVMRLGRQELALDPGAVAAVRRTLTGALEVVCRRCGHPTSHRAATVRALSAGAA
ncbi:MAG TPA: hypothetical protein VK002_06640 [Rubricoccaceae bacterium]|nr:hypothetical protein [Rubricoccaceae bacterium]